jgi:hypothetical protein
VVLESFRLEASEAGDRLSLVLSGTADMAAIEPLAECLVQVRSDVRRKGLSAVEIDIRSLYLLNSSCIKAFVRFIYLIQTEGPQFPVEFLVDPNLSWQARALSALQRMAPGLVSVRDS